MKNYLVVATGKVKQYNETVGKILVERGELQEVEVKKSPVVKKGK